MCPLLRLGAPRRRPRKSPQPSSSAHNGCRSPTRHRAARERRRSLRRCPSARPHACSTARGLGRRSNLPRWVSAPPWVRVAQWSPTCGAQQMRRSSKARSGRGRTRRCCHPLPSSCQGMQPYRWTPARSCSVRTLAPSGWHRVVSSPRPSAGAPGSNCGLVAAMAAPSLSVAWPGTGAAAPR